MSKEDGTDWYERRIQLAAARAGREPTVDEVAAEFPREQPARAYDRDTIAYRLRDRRAMGTTMSREEAFELLENERRNRGAAGW